MVLFFVAVPQTKLYAKKDNFIPGQKTIAYGLSAPEEDFSVEEIVAANIVTVQNVPTWKQGSLATDISANDAGINWKDQDLAAITAGGSAVNRPTIMPGAVMGSKRDEVIGYVIEGGDSLSSIAYKFGISVSTILWENNLSLRSVIRPGDKIRIPPTTGVMYTIKKNDTLNKVANTFQAKPEEITRFNMLKEDGTDLVIGERIMIPNGIAVQSQVVANPSSGNSGTTARLPVPPGSKQSPGVSGFVWPSGVKYISQYYGWTHHAIDIAGPKNTPTYAAKAGTVTIAQCGWNSGYGCYVVINHGGGVKTLYGHHNQLLVKPGDYVEAGQTIGLMGNTGKVRGITGIHLHFEIQINGVRVNPLGYVR
ncbi:peptidoglycan DD-metalloendopeptidase family protein [Patescibacteria group bacterium]|nr:peptidoglycan DD-metalloendopeptidase family protein [Patescibacteria group bacterium]